MKGAARLIYQHFHGRPFVRPVPAGLNGARRHLYHLHRCARHFLSHYRPSSEPLFQSLPFAAVQANVQWMEDEGRAGFEASASCSKRPDVEGRHAEYVGQQVTCRVEAMQRVLDRFN